MVVKSFSGLAAGICLLACAGNNSLLVERSQAESQHLQEFCKRAEFSNPETQKADALVLASAQHLKDGDEEPALAEAELATTLYRLALARRDLNEVQIQVESLKAALAKDKDQLQTYQQILEEMKIVRKP
jgi:hypothetical protein